MSDIFTIAPRALAAVSPVLTGLSEDERARPTPCDDFTVAQVIDHLHLAMTRLAGRAGATLAPGDDLPALVTGALAAWRKRGFDGTVDLRGPLAARRVADIIALELVVHGWDVAVATGRPLAVDDDVIAYLWDAAQDIVPDRRAGAFAAEVEPPADASALQRLVAFTGRHVPLAPVWGDETPVVERAIDWVRRRVVRASDPKTTARPAAELAAAAGPTITAEGIGGERALRIFDEILAPATRAQDDPLMLAYIPAAPTRAAVAFELVTSAANVFAGHWEAGAGAIFAENEALAWLVGLLGWPTDAGGCFVAGGTAGNLAALVAARETARSRHGRAAGARIACTADAHSSIRAIARVMDADVVTVPGDERGRMTGAALRTVLSEQDGVFAVVASAGTTNAGIVDDLAGIADVTGETGTWLHVDGAYGGAALAAPSVRALFRGIERADSFIVDPHKWLFAPYDCCALLYREPGLAQAAHAQNASYLDTVDRRQSNPSDLAVHLSRRARGLPLWFSLATHGTARYAEAVERSIGTARTVAAAIEADPALELVCAPELSVVLFARRGWGEAEYALWSQRLSHEGLMLCLPTRWHGESVLRLAFVNPQTDPARVVQLLSRMEEDLAAAREAP